MSWALGGHMVDKKLKLAGLHIHTIINLVKPKLQYSRGPGRRFTSEHMVRRLTWGLDVIDLVLLF